MAEIIDGTALADTLRTRIAAAVKGFTDAGKRPPGLAVVQVGDDPASRVYVKSKGKRTVEAGMRSFEHVLPRRPRSMTCSPSSRDSTPTPPSTASSCSCPCRSISPPSR